MVKLPLYQVDAFTPRVFGGNPAAVVLLSDWLPDRTMLAIAAENNLSETAFVIPQPDVSGLRWFTPVLEVDLCGHATLAAAHVLFQHCFPSAQQVAFRTQSGRLAVTRAGDLLRMQFPSRPGRPVALTEPLLSAIGRTPREALLARDLLVVFEREEDVRSFRPNLERIAALDAFALIVSAPGDTVDYVCRFFAPRAGVPEDPVTGSAQCTLIPYWAERLGKSKLVARQLSVRGGDIVCERRDDGVVIGGHAVEYLHGEITVEV
jgi:predicted PhzF superfamily epimerase YddE/YHI9